MITTTERDVATIAPLDHDTAMRLAETEYERVATLLHSLEPDDWTRPTECEGWDVRTMVSHVVGMVESLASPREFVSLGFRAWRRPEVYVDGMTAVQVADRRSCTPVELMARYDRALPKAMRTRTRLPKPLRAMPLRFKTPTGFVVKWNVAYLHDVILTRDNWMHRVDIARATGREMVTTPEHDGVLVADAAGEWARTHGQPFHLVLDGPAGGAFRRGSGGESVGPLDAVEFCRILSGRGSGAGLLTTEVPF
jgi:uncharacterized protein (TIGR03083 family)